MLAVGDNLAAGAGETHRIGARGFAALSLFAANAGMLFLYFAFDLTLFEVVVVYWFEALWVGLYSGLKLLTASLFGDPFENRWVDVGPFSAFLLSLYAIAKAGAGFLFLIVITGIALVVANERLTGMPGNDFVAEQGPLLLRCSLLFVIGHGLSFIINFVVLGEFRNARFSTLLWLPFKRAFALFVTIVSALTAMQTWPGALTYTSFAVLLIVVKLTWDWFLHTRERRSFSTRGMQQA
jgi:hypothetical protein